MHANLYQIGGLILLLCTSGSPLVVPTGLVSLLHYIYSRIPVINKGTDSRLGVGFRFGPHADLQFLVELGPQQLTQELGDPQNPPPPSGFDDLSGVSDVSNQLTDRSPAVRSSSIRNPADRNSRNPGPGFAGSGDKRTARSGAADWLGRWQAGVRGRATRSHRKKTENVVKTKKENVPLLEALQRFRDLWGAAAKAGRRAAITAH